jgi:two-component system sensor histidine kinase KdpD
VRSADGLATPNQDLLERHRLLLDQLGGRYTEVSGADVAEALTDFARGENATQIVLGESRRSRWAELTRGSVINRVISKADGIDVHVLSAERGHAATSLRASPGRRPPAPRPRRARLVAWVVAVVGIPLLAIALLPLEETIGTEGVLLVLLLAPVAVALSGGLIPSLVASLIAFLSADWLYIDPRGSFRFARAGDALALAVFVVVSWVVSGLVDRLARRTAEVARSREEAEALAELAQGTAILEGGALQRVVAELRHTLELEAVAVLSPTGDGWHVEAGSGAPLPPTPDDGSYSAELAGGSMLVVAGPPLPAEDRRLLGAFVAHLRLAQATLALQTEATRAAALAEANDLRDALLAAVSHDLRGPLANIKAAATSLLSREVEWTGDDVAAFAKTIDAESDRLTDLIVNLLDMSRLQAGMLGVTLAPVAPAGVVYAALASLTDDVTTVDVEVPETLPLVATDAALLERAVANIIQNALNWRPEGTRVRVEAAALGDRVDIRVIDRGAGIPRDQRLAVFQPFQRLGDGGRAAVQGIGLGLAVAHGFCDAMGAEITIEDTPAGGATVVIGVKVA